MDTTNPLLKREQAFAFEDTQPMTLDGTLIKTAILLALCVVSACAAWTAQPAVQMLLLIVGLLGGFVAVLVASFKPTWSPVLAPAYAILEGLVIGTISYMMEKQYHGLVANACLLTFGVLGAMLLLFITRVIRVTDKLRAGIFAATLAVALIYLVDVVLPFLE